jgi:hypothetical protein
MATIYIYIISLTIRYWGGMTVQGILPYYYHRVDSPNRTLIVDRCYFNTMADTDNCT